MCSLCWIHFWRMTSRRMWPRSRCIAGLLCGTCPFSWTWWCLLIAGTRWSMRAVHGRCVRRLTQILSSWLSKHVFDASLLRSLLDTVDHRAEEYVVLGNTSLRERTKPDADADIAHVSRADILRRMEEDRERVRPDSHNSTSDCARTAGSCRRSTICTRCPPHPRHKLMQTCSTYPARPTPSLLSLSSSGRPRATFTKTMPRNGARTWPTGGAPARRSGRSAVRVEGPRLCLYLRAA